MRETILPAENFFPFLSYIFLPTKKERQLKGLNNEDIISMWKKNNKNFVDFLRFNGQRIPFFGFSASGQKTLLDPHHQEDQYRIDTFTFVKKPSLPEEFLAMLYQLCEAPVLAVENLNKEPVNIYIFNLNGKKDGHNINISWTAEKRETIGFGLSAIITPYDEKVDPLLKCMRCSPPKNPKYNMRFQDYYPQKNILIATKEELEKRCIGKFDFLTARKEYSDLLSSKDINDQVLGQRFLIQELLKTTLQIVS